jgi:predicted nicotinamide N-methyase
MIKSDVHEANGSVPDSLTDTTVSKNNKCIQGKVEKDPKENDGSVTSEDMESLCEELGVLFEGSRSTTWKRFSWDRDASRGENVPSPLEEREKHTRSKIHVAVSCIDDEPGAVQSGHYLWPAAQFLCEYLISKKSEEKRNSSKDIRSVLELGAGMALPSLCALQVFQDSLEFLVATDHDYRTLERARDNYETTMMELYEDAQTEEGQESVVNDISSILVEFLPLKWGPGKRQWKDLQRRLHQDHPTLKTGTQITFDLILGSDLIHSVDMVEPLLQTANMALNKTSETSQTGSIAGRFILSQSFAFDAETESEINRVCDNFQLSRIIVQDNLSVDGSRIQEFHHVDHGVEKR